jgi:hypothetical protein
MVFCSRSYIWLSFGEDCCNGFVKSVPPAAPRRASPADSEGASPWAVVGAQALASDLTTTQCKRKTRRTQTERRGLAQTT